MQPVSKLGIVRCTLMSDVASVVHRCDRVDDARHYRACSSTWNLFSFHVSSVGDSFRDCLLLLAMPVQKELCFPGYSIRVTTDCNPAENRTSSVSWPGFINSPMTCSSRLKITLVIESFKEDREVRLVDISQRLVRNKARCLACFLDILK